MIEPSLIEAIRAAVEANKSVCEACLHALKQIEQQAAENKYVSPEDAAAALGSAISADMLKERCTDGRFRHGVHFINTSDSKRGNYAIKVSAVRKFFETEPAKRPLPRRA